jgi:Zn-finger nucleic acid-binding protein
MCPNCKKLMVVLELEGVEVDRCLECGGTWLDAGELELVLRLAGAATEKVVPFLESKAGGARGTRRCPRCRRKLRVFKAGKDKAIALDRCPRGHGLWFDARELEEVISSGGEGDAAHVARFFSEMYRSELEMPKKGE